MLHALFLTERLLEEAIVIPLRSGESRVSLFRLDVATTSHLNGDVLSNGLAASSSLHLFDDPESKNFHS